MPVNPISDTLSEPISTSLEYSLSRLRLILRMPQNVDVITRRLTIGGFSAAILFYDGMVDQSLLHSSAIRPAMEAAPYEGEAASRAQWLVDAVLSAADVKTHEMLDDVVESMLVGNAIILVDGCPIGVTIDCKGYKTRCVDKPINETVVTGPHEAFVESTKVNLTLLRRILHTPRLVTEQHLLGTGVHTACSIVYLDGVANTDILTEVRRRISNIDLDFVMTAGDLEQLIEDRPYSLIPQLVHTERPDRAASFLISGMVLIFVEGSPSVIAVPATLVHLLHTPDMNTMRFVYGSFKRIIITFGLACTVLIPALYIAVVMFHIDVMPLALVTSIYETQSRIPVSLLLELLFLSFGFDLILEAGARMPGVLVNGLGAISALILGQAVVAADLVSPLLIVVVAISGLGTLIVPEYNLTIALRIMQYILILVAAIGGLYGLLLVLFVLGIELCSQTSMGVPLVWHSAPERMHNPDNVGRYPIWQQRIRMYLSNPTQMLRSFSRMRAWDKGGKRDG